MPIDSPDFIYHIRCPQCGQAFDYTPCPPREPPSLSPLAHSILTARGELASKWRRGKPVSLRKWAAIVFADPMSVRSAMLELVTDGYAAAVPFGRKRLQYVGVPSRVLVFEQMPADEPLRALSAS